MKHFLLLLLVFNIIQWDFLSFAQSMEIVEAATENDTFHSKEAKVIDEFVKEVNEFFKIHEGKKLTSSEFLNALKLQHRDITPLTREHLQILFDVVKTNKVPAGTEVRYSSKIQLDESTGPIDSDIIKVTFGMKGLLVDGVRFKPSEEQSIQIFSVYIRLKLR